MFTAPWGEKTYLEEVTFPTIQGRVVVPVVGIVVKNTATAYRYRRSLGRKKPGRGSHQSDVCLVTFWDLAFFSVDTRTAERDPERGGGVRYQGGQHRAAGPPAHVSRSVMAASISA